MDQLALLPALGRHVSYPVPVSHWLFVDLPSSSSGHFGAGSRLVLFRSAAISAGVFVYRPFRIDGQALVTSRLISGMDRSRGTAKIGHTVLISKFTVRKR